MSFFQLPFHWNRRTSPHRIFWLGMPVLLYSWTLAGPFLSDDLHLILKSERYIRGETQHLNLMRFATSDDEWRVLRDRGTCPWWVPESGRLDFFRPITEWAFYLDVRLFGRNPVGYRMMSLAVFAIALICVHRLFRAAGADAIRAGTATFMLGISQTLTPPVTWMANRQDLLVVIGVTLAASAYWQSLKQPRQLQVIHAAAAFAFALLAKEVAIAFAGVVLFHELHRRNWKPSQLLRHTSGHITLVLLLISAVYLSYYAYSRPWAFGIGAGDGTPNQFNTRLPFSLLFYSSVWTLGFPVDILYNASPIQTGLLAGIATLLLIMTVHYMRRSSRNDSAALFFLLWAIFFVIPGLRSLTTGTRTLCTATVGWVYLAAGLLVPSREEDVVVPIFFRHVLYAANGIVSIIAAIITVLFMNHSELDARHRLSEILARQKDPLTRGETVFITQAHSSLEIMCAADRLEFMTGCRGVAVNYLLPPEVSATTEPIDSHTLLVSSTGNSLLGAPFHRLVRGPDWNLGVGQCFDLRDFSVQIDEISADGRVTRLRVKFGEPLASHRFRFDPKTLAAAIQRTASLQIAQAAGQ